jgi:hypothetical protein
VEAELERHKELNIIIKVDGPTPWVSPFVVAPKPKNLLKCMVAVVILLSVSIVA